MTAEALAKTTLTVANEGDEPVDAVVTVIGAALTPEPAVSKGFTIERSYYTLDGKPVDLKSATGGTGTVKQNDRFIAVVKIEAKEPGGRVLLVDRLPAGFEIENPRLVEQRRRQGARLAQDVRCGRSTASSATTASSPRSTSTQRASRRAATEATRTTTRATPPRRKDRPRRLRSPTWCAR